MQDKTAEQIEDTKWAGQLKKELEKRTGRKDIEVKASPYYSYKAMVTPGTDGHPVVGFSTALQQNPKEVASTLDYVSEKLEIWEATKILHAKTEEDCRPFFNRLKAEFPHMALNYNIIDSGRHCLWIAKKDGEILGYFDLWPMMTEPDIERIASYIRDFEATLRRENATAAEITYGWA